MQCTIEVKNMKTNRFDVVELKSNNKATILKINNNGYFAEIVDSDRNTIDKRNIFQQEIKRIIYTR